jgi:predicted nucleic acid-binding protein
MIVVDSSVWIAQLRGLPTAAVARLERLVEEDDILVGDIVLLEILQGARDDAHAAAIERQMRKFPIEAMSSPALAVDAARSYRALRDRGVTVRKTIDMIIGSFCIRHGHALLHDNRDFDAMQRYLGLRVV